MQGAAFLGTAFPAGLSAAACWMPRPCQHSHFYCVFMIPQQVYGLEPSAQRQQSWEMLQCQSWARGANPTEECVQPRELGSWHTPECLRSTCTQYTESVGTGWGHCGWSLLPVLGRAFPTGTCLSPRTEKMVSDGYYCLHLSPHRHFRGGWSLLFPPNSKFFPSQGKHAEEGVNYLTHSRNIQPYHHV